MRLALAAGINGDTVSKVFHSIWVEGKSPSTAQNLSALADTLGVEDYEQAISQPRIKQQLRENTEHASQLGIFGVPTIIIDDQIFWGNDLTEMAMAYLQNKELFDTEGYKRLLHIPNGLKG